MKLYEKQFSKKYDFPRVKKPKKTLIIASTGRCGSHMLGHALQKTKCFGFPLEYINYNNFIEWQKRFNKTALKDIVDEIQQCRTSPNGVFGIKLHYSHIKRCGGFRYLEDYFPNPYFVHLSRSNVLQQAISLSIARQTGVWISGQEATSKKRAYDFDDITSCLRETIIENASWSFVLSASGCNFIEMDFDLVKRNIPSAIQQIADFMGEDVPRNMIPHEQVTQKQGNQLNLEWQKKYIDAYRNAELSPRQKTNYGSIWGRIQKQGAKFF